jgi:hypothetical protein
LGLGIYEFIGEEEGIEGHESLTTSSNTHIYHENTFIQPSSYYDSDGSDGKNEWYAEDGVADSPEFTIYHK